MTYKHRDGEPDYLATETHDFVWGWRDGFRAGYRAAIEAVKWTPFVMGGLAVVGMVIGVVVGYQAGLAAP